MYDIIIFRTNPLIELKEIEVILRNLFPKGVCLNIFKIEQMINPISLSNFKKTISDKPLYLTLLDSFYNLDYSPIILIGGFLIDEISYLKSLYGDKIFSLSLFSSDTTSLLKSKNRNNYNLLNTEDILNKLKSKRTTKYNYNEALLLNKRIAETINLTNISIDTSVSNTNKIILETLSSI